MVEGADALGSSACAAPDAALGAGDPVCVLLTAGRGQVNALSLGSAASVGGEDGAWGAV